MESLSRPPHRRKHSAANSSFASFSTRNPYDHVLLSGGGAKAKPFGARDYAAIFAGSSSSIPLLDLPGLDERAGLGGGLSSKLDYSNIFGGLRSDDVAVPYEELLGSTNKTLTSSAKKCMPSDMELPVQESDSLRCSGKTKLSSNESADQSIDGMRKQFNLSFNKTSTSSSDVANGNTHIAQLQAVPGFTYFIDGAHLLQKTENDKPVQLLKRDVSRTWSFSADVEAVNGKGGSIGDNSGNPDNCHNMTENNGKTHISNVPPPSISIYNLKEHNIVEGSETSVFSAKQDTSGKVEDDCSPPFFGTELDENSVAAISAAALKRAMDQAQESIRLAKLIMEKKRDGIPNGSKSRAKGHLNVKDASASRTGIQTNCSKEKHARETLEKFDPVFWGSEELSNITDHSVLLNAKIDPPVCHKVSKSDSEAIKLEVRGNVEAAKQCGEEYIVVGKEFPSSCSPTETFQDIEKVEFELLEKNIQDAGACTWTTTFPGLACGNFTLGHTQIDESNNLVYSMNTLAYNHEDVASDGETLEQKEMNVRCTERHDDLVDAEQACNTLRLQKPENVRFGDLENDELNFDLAQGAENAETALNMSQSTPVKEYVPELVATSRIIQEYEVTVNCQNIIYDRQKGGVKFDRIEEIVNMEHSRSSDLTFNNLMNDQWTVYKEEAMEQEEIVNNFVNGLECAESDHKHGKNQDELENDMRPKDAGILSEAKEQPKKAVEELINKREPKVCLELRDERNSNHVHEGENVDLILSFHLDNARISGAPEPNEINENYVCCSKNEPAGAEQMSTNFCAEVQRHEVSQSAEEANIFSGSGKAVENQNKHLFQDAAYDMSDESLVDKSNHPNIIFSGFHSHNTDGSTFFVSQESCDKDFSDKIEENNYVPGGTATISATETAKKAVRQTQLENNDLCRTNSLRHCASEGNFVESNLYHTIEGLSVDHYRENVDFGVTNNEETLLKGHYIHKSTEEICNYVQEIDDRFNNLPNLSSDCETEEYELTDVRVVSETTSESDRISESSSILENTDVVSSYESSENAKETSDKEEVEEIDIASNQINQVQTEIVHSEKKIEGEHSQLQSDHNGMEEFMETEITTADQNFGNTEKTIDVSSTMEEKLSKDNFPNFDKEDHRQRIEAIKKGRAREKDRIAVERVMHEARDRAFAEACEWAGRVATGKTASEVRKRAMSGAQEKLDKSSTVTKLPADKASAEAKLRSERAAVERATAEARERALEKAMTLKTPTEGRQDADSCATECSRNNGLKHSLSSSELEKFDGTNNESAQRRKARLERHQRIMDRAAKALAEKNMRDLLVQKEQAERNRLADSLDADIKRWVTGKEGNLRALLSTLQYILGTNNGWQPISLTEIITTAAVKKAYRKATLYVHPDKLQQRGATIQQKYICEKVFDLLQAAWNRFNSEER